MVRLFYILFLLFADEISFAQQDSVFIRFENYANGKPVVLNDSIYSNAFGEKYYISRLKYYVSNIRLITDQKKDTASNIFLMDEPEHNTDILIPKPAGKIKAVEFLLGVDSLLNCSGAQDGVLDPLNNMFWTWNNGYVMFKLEGTSGSSKADRQRIEQHIGGYRDGFKTMRQVYIPLNYDYLSPLSLIVIRLNLDNYWKGKNDIKISEKPVIAVPGAAAVQAADNFPGMFSVSATCCFDQ